MKSEKYRLHFSGKNIRVNTNLYFIIFHFSFSPFILHTHITVCAEQAFVHDVSSLKIDSSVIELSIFFRFISLYNNFAFNKIIIPNKKNG